MKIIKTIGHLIEKGLSNFEESKKQRMFEKAFNKKLSNAFDLLDDENYYHIISKIQKQFYRDGDSIRAIEDVSSWAEETPDDRVREALLELKLILEKEDCNYE